MSGFSSTRPVALLTRFTMALCLKSNGPQEHQDRGQVERIGGIEQRVIFVIGLFAGYDQLDPGQ